MSNILHVALLFLTVSVAFCQTVPPQSAFNTYLIQSAEAKIKKSPAIAEGYSDLAFALSRRARETEDPIYWKQAEQAIATALKWDPTNFDARKTRVIVRIQQGRFADALEEAVALNKKTPDDNLMYGLLADIALAQGRYSDAEALAQRMMDLRQVNGPGLERAAQVREIIGFPDGAQEFWVSALRLASTADLEERAYLLTQIAGLSRRLGKLEEATHHVSDALALEPDYPAALVEQARIALNRKKPDEALASVVKRLQENENVAAHYWKFKALQALGRNEEAKAEGELFASRSRTAKQDDLLIRYLTSQGSAAEAVEIGRKLAEKGTNAETREAYAMALLATNRPKDASEQMDTILANGVKDPSYFLDASSIRKALHDADGAKAYLKKCIEVNATSAYANQAFAELQNPSNVP